MEPPTKLKVSCKGKASVDSLGCGVSRLGKAQQTEVAPQVCGSRSGGHGALGAARRSSRSRWRLRGSAWGVAGDVVAALRVA